MKKMLIVLTIMLALGLGFFYFRNSIFPSSSDTLRIVMNTPETDLSPYGLDLNNATRIQNIYEGLVAFDINLKLVPALAVSWGNIGENEWEFRLRQGVKFHDGSPFGPQDVLDAFQKAQTSGNSQIAVDISTIKDIRETEDGRIVVTTFSPDPLLLSKLTKLFVYHANNVGTGPYMLKEWIPKTRFALTAFPDYWREKPVFKNVNYDVVTSRAQREDEFTRGKIDVLIGVSEEQAMSLPKEQIVTNYGMEVNFLMFEMNDPVFKDRNIREAIYSLIDPRQIEAIGNHFVKSSDQFIAPGVFGYNPNIPSHPYDSTKEARNLFGKRLERISFDYLTSFRTLSNYLSSQMTKGGFSVKENAVEPDILIKKIQNHESPLFLIGWRAEDGDAGGFFDAFVYSKGPFNNGRYSNPEVDKLIEQSRIEMNPQKRLSLLQEIGAKVNDDLIGIPLFETSRLFAIKKGINLKSNLGGQVLAADVGQGK